MTSTALSQLLNSGRIFLADGGLETCMIFHEGFDLPHFASFVLVDTREGRAALDRYFTRYMSIAKRSGTGFVLDTATWRANMGWARALGHSLGSLVAQKLAQLAPHRFTTLTLIGAFVRLGQNPAVQELNAEAIEPMKDPVDPGFVRSFQESAVGPATSPEIIQCAVAESMKLTADDWKAALVAGMLTDLTHALDRYQRPVLVLHGELDTFSLVEEQQELVRGTGRKLISLAHWGHSPHWEYPADVAAIISSFLGGREDERRAA